MSAPALLAADAPASAPPLATVFGEAVLDAPADLFIPPDALRVFLESFEGPLDLLLYLIRKQNLNVLDIPMARVTAQYMEYIAAMRAALVARQTVGINQAMATLNEASGDFAARRMDRNIRRALTGQKISEL